MVHRNALLAEDLGWRTVRAGAGVMATSVAAHVEDLERVLAGAAMGVARQYQ